MTFWKPLERFEIGRLGFFSLSAGLLAAAFAAIAWELTGPGEVTPQLIGLALWGLLIAARLRDIGAGVWLAAAPVVLTAAIWTPVVIILHRIHLSDGLSDGHAFGAILIALAVWALAILGFTAWLCLAPSRRRRQRPFPIRRTPV